MKPGSLYSVYFKVEKLPVEACLGTVVSLHLALPGHLPGLQAGPHRGAGHGIWENNFVGESKLCPAASYIPPRVLRVAGSEEVVGAVCQAALA